MQRIIFSLLCFLLSLNVSSSSSRITCKYETHNYHKIGDLYQCNLASPLYITNPESAKIESVAGQHAVSKIDDDVAGFYLYGNTVELFPRGLEGYFKNIKAITLGSCKIKEIYQEDLKPFPKLIYLYIPTSDIEVIEEGLFAYNPDLVVLGVEGSKVTHIDPNVFDHLTKLDYFWFAQVPCANVKYIYDSKIEIEDAIKSIKARCVNSEYTALAEKIKVLENEAKTLDSENFKKNLQNFEQNFKNSKFSKYRPLRDKFDNLKAGRFDNSASIVSTSVRPSTYVSKCSEKKSSISCLINELRDVTLDLKSSQCGLNGELSEVKEKIGQSQSNKVALLSDINSKVSDIKSLHSQILDLKKSTQTDLKLTQNDLKDTIGTSNVAILDSLSNLTKNIKSSQDDARTLQYEIKGSISDMESNLSGLKTFQNEVKVALIKLKTTQNEIKMSIDELKVDKNENSRENSGNCDGKLGNLEHIEGQLAELASKVDASQKEMTNKFHKMSIDFDIKIKGTEKRIMKNFEEVLEKKLKELLSEKV